MLSLYTYLASRLRDEEDGQGMVEYALILVLVSVVAIAILTTIGTNVTGVFGDIADALSGFTP